MMKYVLFIVCLLLVAANKAGAQNNHSAAIAAADTSRFSVNTRGGWQLFNSFLSKSGSDSAKLELIIQHQRTLNWQTAQYIGKIKEKALLPKTVQYVTCYLLSDKYLLHILQNGQCYLQLALGNLPVGDPVILPLTLKYKL